MELHKHLLLSSQTHSPGKDKDISPCSVSLLWFGVSTRAAEEPQALCSRAVTLQGEVLSSLHFSGPWMVQKP